MDRSEAGEVGRRERWYGSSVVVAGWLDSALKR
jgi:hypothetical protein